MKHYAGIDAIGCGLRDAVYPNCLYLNVFASPTADEGGGKERKEP
jgi:hypothetical protein